MFKIKIYTVIYLSILVPVLLSAAALNKYTAPIQSVSSTQSKKTVNESVYVDFQQQVHDYSPKKKEKMKTYYRKKLKDAIRIKNLDAATHYERLLGILN
ncbi:MAG: hypothetical protein DRG09_02135 [Epsilonproteobacteria bacterium]|nr:MAG: hypothetical protein DRG09_02135 [Campylobacterota bacterium]